MKLKTESKYWGEFQVLPNGILKVVRANRLVGVNQHKNKWKRIHSRDFARAISGKELVTN